MPPRRVLDDSSIFVNDFSLDLGGKSHYLRANTDLLWGGGVRCSREQSRNRTSPKSARADAPGRGRRARAPTTSHGTRRYCTSSLARQKVKRATKCHAVIPRARPAARSFRACAQRRLCVEPDDGVRLKQARDREEYHGGWQGAPPRLCQPRRSLLRHQVRRGASAASTEEASGLLLSVHIQPPHLEPSHRQPGDR